MQRESQAYETLLCMSSVYVQRSNNAFRFECLMVLISLKVKPLRLTTVKISNARTKPWPTTFRLRVHWEILHFSCFEHCPYFASFLIVWNRTLNDCNRSIWTRRMKFSPKQSEMVVKPWHMSPPLTYGESWYGWSNHGLLRRFLSVSEPHEYFLQHLRWTTFMWGLHQRWDWSSHWVTPQHHGCFNLLSFITELRANRRHSCCIESFSRKCCNMGVSKISETQIKINWNHNNVLTTS